MGREDWARARLHGLTPPGRLIVTENATTSFGIMGLPPGCRQALSNARWLGRACFGSGLMSRAFSGSEPCSGRQQERDARRTRRQGTAGRKVVFHLYTL